MEKETVSELAQVETAIREFERQAAGDDRVQDASFQKAWDDAVRRWWALAEDAQDPNDGGTIGGTNLTTEFLSGALFDGDVLA